MPKDRDAPPSDVDKWPHAVQVGWILCKPDGSVEEERDYIVKPDGWTIPDAAAKVHGITTDRALALFEAARDCRLSLRFVPRRAAAVQP